MTRMTTITTMTMMVPMTWMTSEVTPLFKEAEQLTVMI